MKKVNGQLRGVFLLFNTWSLFFPFQTTLIVLALFIQAVSASPVPAKDDEGTLVPKVNDAKGVVVSEVERLSRMEKTGEMNGEQSDAITVTDDKSLRNLDLGDDEIVDDREVHEKKEKDSRAAKRSAEGEEEDDSELERQAEEVADYEELLESFGIKDEQEEEIDEITMEAEDATKEEEIRDVPQAVEKEESELETPTESDADLKVEEAVEEEKLETSSVVEEIQEKLEDDPALEQVVEVESKEELSEEIKEENPIAREENSEITAEEKEILIDEESSKVEEDSNGVKAANAATQEMAGDGKPEITAEPKENPAEIAEIEESFEEDEPKSNAEPDLEIENKEIMANMVEEEAEKELLLEDKEDDPLEATVEVEEELPREAAIPAQVEQLESDDDKAVVAVDLFEEETKGENEIDWFPDNIDAENGFGEIVRVGEEEEKSGSDDIAKEASEESETNSKETAVIEPEVDSQLEVSDVVEGTEDKETDVDSLEEEEEIGDDEDSKSEKEKARALIFFEKQEQEVEETGVVEASIREEPVAKEAAEEEGNVDEEVIEEKEAKEELVPQDSIKTDQASNANQDVEVKGDAGDEKKSELEDLEAPREVEEVKIFEAEAANPSEDKADDDEDRSKIAELLEALEDYEGSEDEATDDDLEAESRVGEIDLEEEEVPIDLDEQESPSIGGSASFDPAVQPRINECRTELVTRYRDVFDDFCQIVKVPTEDKAACQERCRIKCDEAAATECKVETREVCKTKDKVSCNTPPNKEERRSCSQVQRGIFSSPNQFLDAISRNFQVTKDVCKTVKGRCSVTEDKTVCKDVPDKSCYISTEYRIRKRDCEGECRGEECQEVPYKSCEIVKKPIKTCQVCMH